ncbi:MAG: cellulase N-terminal Ig-like domain-containing protein, partial [Lysobacterales bacterium]
MKFSQTLPAAILVLVACASSLAPQSATAQVSDPAPSIHLNQLGFKPGGLKQAVVVDAAGDEFEVLDAGTRAQVWSGVLLPARRWKPSGETVRLADFSALRTAGEYVVRV